MAFHKLDRPIDIGELFGQGISSGIGKIIDARTTQKGLESIGYSPDEARKMSFFHPALLKESVKAKLNPSQAHTNINIGGKPFAAYTKDAAQSASQSGKALQYIKELRDLNKSGNLGRWFGKTESNKSFEGNVAALESFAKNNPLVKKLSSRLKYGDSREAIDAQIDQIEKEFKKEIYKDQAINEILQQTNGEIPSDFEDIVSQRVESLANGQSQQTAPEQDLNQPNQSILDILGEGLRATGGIAAKGVQGLGEGVTGILGAPFNIANLLTGGNVPVPQAVQSLQKAPEAIVKGLTGELTTPQSDTEALVGDTVKDIASFLSPAGLLGLAGKGLNLVGKGSKWLDAASKVLKISPKAAAATAGLSNTAKFLTKKVGGGEGAQEAAKIGTMLAVPLLGSRFMGNEIKKLAQDAVTKVPKETVTSLPIANTLNALFNKLEKMPENALTKKVLKEVQKNSGVQFSAPNLFSLKDTVMNAEKSLGSSVKSIVSELTKHIDTALAKVAEKSPEFSRSFERYKDLSNALNQSNKVADFVGRKFKGGLVRNPWATLGFSALGIPKYKTLGVIGAGALGAGEIERFGQMLAKSPEFRNSAAGFLNASLQGSVKSATQYARKMEKIAQQKK